MVADTPSIGGRVAARFGEWFGRLQALAPKPEELDPEDWTGRWYDGATPEEALEAGPDED